VELVVEVGLGEKCRDLLADDNIGTAEVRRESKEYGHAFECSGVPMFIVDSKYILNGAQEDTVFLRVFGKLQ